MGSLLSEDIRALEELGLLPTDVESEALTQNNETAELEAGGSALVATNNSTIINERRGTSGDLSWFEQMISGSALGRTQRTRRGMGVSADGATTVEWEVSEIRAGESEPDSGTGRAKRKIGDVGKGEDVEMK